MRREYSDPVDSPSRNDWQTIKTLFPYLWPEKEAALRWRVIVAVIFLAAAKGTSVAVPLIYKHAVDALDSKVSAAVAVPVLMLLAYGGARVLSQAFGELRDAVFARVAQRAIRLAGLKTFRHLHQLSLRFHLDRKTGGISRAVERGTKGIEFLLRFMLFNIVPTLFEIALTCGILWYLFGPLMALVTFATISLYIFWTLWVTEWRIQFRRTMNKTDNEANTKAIDSLLNFETVKYFGAEEREAARYDSAMQGYERAALLTSYSLAFLNFGQAFLITGGLVAVMVMAAMGVQNGTMTVGDFVMVNAYMIQITMPLNFLGTVYREIRQALVDMGEMFDLLEQPAEVTDKPDAKPLEVSGGEITLDDVRFGYDPAREILKGVSLSVGAGQSVAIVGATGSGKSTIGRLLFRFYDVSAGALRIDGQDVRDVTQQSLHDAIGVVPQDTVLFNDTIRYNIAYGRDGATQEDVEAAARAAQIHDFILSLPKGYDTMVGERGLKLSGGEKQRVGIARTLLKNPPILLLDEATSALDSQTEHDIQSALRRAGQGRTVITIAHRLSTVAEADQIVVLDAGEVAERGTHEELLTREGRYAQLWHRQQAEDVAA